MISKVILGWTEKQPRQVPYNSEFSIFIVISLLTLFELFVLLSVNLFTNHNHRAVRRHFADLLIALIWDISIRIDAIDFFLQTSTKKIQWFYSLANQSRNVSNSSGFLFTLRTRSFALLLERSTAVILPLNVRRLIKEATRTENVSTQSFTGIMRAETVVLWTFLSDGLVQRVMMEQSNLSQNKYICWSVDARQHTHSRWSCASIKCISNVSLPRQWTPDWYSKEIQCYT